MTERQQALKPCPFCKSKAVQQPHMLYVACERCQMRGPNYTATLGEFQREHEAARWAWNELPRATGEPNEQRPVVQDTGTAD